MHRGVKAILVITAALLLSGCVLSDSLRHDEIYSVWGRRLPPREVFYVTDRAPDGDGFSSRWDGGAAHCGRARVTIAAGGTQVAPDPALEPVPCDGADMGGFAAMLAAAAKTAGCDRVLLEIHGFNLTFRASLLHGAQAASDMQWPCVTLLFNWSSQALFDRYLADIERSAYAVPLLIETLAALHHAGLKPDILAHSMGARMAMGALGALCRTPDRLADELILAAADVGAEASNDDFGTMLAREAPCVGRTTIYASDQDMALMLSESLHGGAPRAGRAPARDLLYQTGAARARPGQVDVVDASLSPGDDAGHAYYVFSYEMLADMMWTFSGATRAERAARGLLDCADRPEGTCAAGDGRYSLKVAKERRPEPGLTLMREIVPAILPLQ